MVLARRATLALGFLPQELLGTSMYEYYHREDVHHLAESHKAALNAAEVVTTKVRTALRVGVARRLPHCCLLCSAGL